MSGEITDVGGQKNGVPIGAWANAAAHAEAQVSATGRTNLRARTSCGRQKDDYNGVGSSRYPGAPTARQSAQLACFRLKHFRSRCRLHACATAHVSRKRLKRRKDRSRGMEVEKRSQRL